MWRQIRGLPMISFCVCVRMSWGSLAAGEVQLFFIEYIGQLGFFAKIIVSKKLLGNFCECEGSFFPIRSSPIPANHLGETRRRWKAMCTRFDDLTFWGGSLIFRDHLSLSSAL